MLYYRSRLSFDRFFIYKRQKKATHHHNVKPIRSSQHSESRTEIKKTVLLEKFSEIIIFINSTRSNCRRRRPLDFPKGHCRGETNYDLFACIFLFLLKFVRYIHVVRHLRGSLSKGYDDAVLYDKKKAYVFIRSLSVIKLKTNIACNHLPTIYIQF